MNVNHFELKKTALLFFDILNGYVADAGAGQAACSEAVDSKRRRGSAKPDARPDCRFFRQGQSSPRQRDHRAAAHRHQ